MQSTTTTFTTTMLVSPNKAPSSKPAADRDSSSWSAWAGNRCTISTPPPFEDSFITKSPSSGSKMRRPMMSPPPLPKRSKHFVVPSGGYACCNNNSSAPEQPKTPPSANSVLIDLNGGHSILNNPMSADVPPLRLVAPPSVSTQEPQEEGNISIDSFTSNSRNGPILSFNASDDDSSDAELASYFPRIKLQMRSRRRRRSDPRHTTFIPIQDDPSEESSGDHDC
mmetsp:Transcript_2638/g.4490  ORF Transcript_2638/g.4490 Transcript_2638/m.4490 type:complete len:224 (+) Transcript_2638:123-794(+)